MITRQEILLRFWTISLFLLLINDRFVYEHSVAFFILFLCDFYSFVFLFFVLVYFLFLDWPRSCGGFAYFTFPFNIELFLYNYVELKRNRSKCNITLQNYIDTVY